MGYDDGPGGVEDEWTVAATEARALLSLEGVSTSLYSVTRSAQVIDALDGAELLRAMTRTLRRARQDRADLAAALRGDR